MGCRELQVNDYFIMAGSASGTDVPYYALADANKNITEYIDASGTIQAHYEYSPFGKITQQSGTMASDFDYRFSSEVFDSETGLSYYNYRYYSAELGRWLSRDPIGEKGGINLYVMIGNIAINWIDYLGLDKRPESLEWEVLSIRSEQIPKKLPKCEKGKCWEKDVEIKTIIVYWRLAPGTQTHLEEKIDNFIKSIGEDGACGKIANKGKDQLWGKAKQFIGASSVSYALFEWRKEETIWIKRRIKCDCGNLSFEFIDSGVDEGEPYPAGLFTPVLQGKKAEDFWSDQVFDRVNDAFGGVMGKCIK